jgi:hypothetical protein
MVRHIMTDCLGLQETATAFKYIFGNCAIANSVTLTSLPSNEKLYISDITYDFSYLQMD